MCWPPFASSVTLSRVGYVSEVSLAQHSQQQPGCCCCCCCCCCTARTNFLQLLRPPPRDPRSLSWAGTDARMSAGVVRTNYCYSGRTDLGKVAARKSSHTGGYDWFSNSEKLSVHGAHSRYISAAAHAATGNGAFSGNRAEDINDALSTVLPHTYLEKDSPAFKAILAAIASLALEAEKQRRHHEVYPGKTEVPVDALRQGRLVESRLVYRQTFVIRSYEIGADRTASIETMMNHFQETALNHVWMSGLAGDGFGATRAMSCRNLIWVVTRMQVHVEQYPAWGDVVEMDTWVAASGKNGMRRDWLVRDYKTGQILARATSTWVMMNRKTRKLSKMPEEVRAEISPYFLERSAIKDESLLTQKIIRLNGNAEFVRSGLTPRRSDLDMNQHVNNVKYIGWMMESVPPAILDGYELASMSLEYRRECGQSDVVQSMTSLEPSTTSSESASAEGGAESNGAARSHSLSSSHIAAEGAKMQQQHSIASQVGFLQLVHLLRMENDGAEIVRGRTQWRPKNIPSPL